MCDTSWKLQIFTKARAITHLILNKSTWNYPGAQLHMLSNIPVKFHDSRSNTFELSVTQNENKLTRVNLNAPPPPQWGHKKHNSKRHNKSNRFWKIKGGKYIHYLYIYWYIGKKHININKFIHCNLPLQYIHFI
jgi:hypothetical protein